MNTFMTVRGNGTSTTTKKPMAAPSMRTEIKLVTPAMAEQWLANNPLNRRIDSAVVTQLAAMIRGGQWRLTHQGILLGHGGMLLDGQHRLLAIVRANHAVLMQVTVDETADTVVGLPVDIGMKRQPAFILGVSKGFAGVLNWMIRILVGRNVAAMEMQPYVARLEAVYPKIVVPGKGTQTRVFSSAPVTLAACVHAQLDPEHTDYYQRTYYALCIADPAQLSPRPYSFWRQYQNRKGTRQSDIYARAIRAFSYENRDLAKLGWKNWDYVWDEAVTLTKTAFGDPT